MKLADAGHSVVVLEAGAAEARLGEAMHQLERKLTDDAERAGSEALDTVSRSLGWPRLWIRWLRTT